MTLAGFSAVFLLGRVGEPVRPLLISRKDKIPLADTFGIYALERLLDMGFSRRSGVLGFWYWHLPDISHPDATASSSRKRAAPPAPPFPWAYRFIALVIYIRIHGASMLEGKMQAGSPATVGGPTLPGSSGFFVE